MNQPMRLMSLTLIAGLALACSAGALADDLQWSGTGSVWDNGLSAYWYNPVGGSTLDVFNSLDSVTFDDTGSANTAVELVGSINPGSITDSGFTSYTLTGDGTLTGATTTFTKTGLGTFTIDNTGGASLGGNVNLGAGILSFGANSGASSLSGNVAISGSAIVDVSGDASATLSGVVSDSGAAGLHKTGTGTLTLGNAANTYTGANVFDGGTVVASVLANGGVSSSIGRSSSAASNLVLNQATLHYTGPAVEIDRAFSHSGDSVIRVDNSLKMTGGTGTTSGKLTKEGPGTLELYNPVNGTYTLGDELLVTGPMVLDGAFDYPGLFIGDGSAWNVNQNMAVGYGADAGSLTINKGGLLVPGFLTTIGDAGSTASLTMNGTAYFGGHLVRLGGHNGATVTVEMNDSSQIVLDSLANFGTQGCQSTLNMHDDASITLSKFEFGWGANVNATGVLDGNSSITTTLDNLVVGLGGANATGTITLNENASIDVANWMMLGYGAAGATGSITMNGNSTLHAAGFTLLGYSGEGATGNLTMTGDSVATLDSNFWVGIAGNESSTEGSLTMSGNASLSAAAVIGGDGGNSGYAYGTITLSDYATISSVDKTVIGSYRNGECLMTMSGNSRLEAGGPIAIADRMTTTGTLIMSENAVATAQTWFAVGNATGGGGTGAAYLSGHASATAYGRLEVAYSGTGTLHLGDGTATDEAVFTSTNALALGWGTHSEDSRATINLNAGGKLVTPGVVTGHYADNPYTTEDESAPGAVSSVINFNGGTLVATADDTAPVDDDPAIPFITNNEWLQVYTDDGTAENYSAEHFGGSQDFQLNVQAGGAVIDTNGHTISIDVALTEDASSTGGGLTKLGAGTLTLSSSTGNTYTGETKVEVGTLSITGNDMLSDDAALWIAASAVVNLDFTGTAETVGGLYLNGSLMAEGTWGATGSGAANIDDVYFTGTGMLLVDMPTQIPGDANGDKKVNDLDAAALAAHWGVTSGAQWSDGDFNKDGAVDMLDASIMAANWGDHTGAESVVPEPGALALLLALALGLIARRNRP